MTATPFTSRTQVEEALLARAESNESFRRDLLTDPRTVLAKDFGISISPEVKLNVVEETTRNLYLVLPARAASAAGQLTDIELELVAGGSLAAEKANDAGKLSKLVGVAGSRAKDAAE